jgi:hypothetical protein
MNNTNTSPLYDLVRTKLKYKTRKYLGSRTIQLVTDAISYVIDNCCVKDFPKTVDPFVVMVYTLLKQMQGFEHRQKLIAVRDLLLQNCCITPLPSNCIEFVVDTTDGSLNFRLDIYSSIESYTYTVTWGDGSTRQGSSDEGSVTLEHEYASETSYTARVCFSDPSVITSLNFPGND